MTTTGSLIMGNKKYKQKHRELGLCLYCSDPVHEVGQFCLKHTRTRIKNNKAYRIKHLEKYTASDNLRKQRRRDNGQCTGCSVPLDPDADAGRITCVNCREGTHTERLIHGTVIV